MPEPRFRLALAYWPASATEMLRYEFRLSNLGTQAIAGFSLGWSAPGRIDPDVPIDNARLQRRLSNYTEVAPPTGFVLEPGQEWVFVVRGLGKEMRHWTDAARAAFIVPPSGEPIAVDVGVCRLRDDPGPPLLGIDRTDTDTPLPDGVALVPYPREIAIRGEQPLPTALAPAGSSEAAAAAIAAFTALTTVLFSHEALVASDGTRVELVDAALAPDCYRLLIDRELRIEAGGSGGFLYGLITLGQIVIAARHDPVRCRFPAVARIEDAPHFGWRGAHLDVARQFYAIAELMRLLAIMAWNKLNRFHLHLTEDEAWRWEVEAYPELTATGAYRGHGLALPPLLGSGAERYGGSYRRAELRELVQYAGTLNIEIMPEIDVPGHCYAAVTALPWLRDAGENGEYRSVQGFANNALSPAVPRTMEFVETLFRELIDIFPGRWVHVGADEVPDDAWQTSPLARARLAELGGGGPSVLQADFLRRLHAQLRAAGRITGAWEEGALGGGITPDDALLFAWRTTRAGGELAACGYDVVVTPGQAYYLDMALGPDWWEPGAAWAGCSSAAQTYAFDPAAGFVPDDRHRLRGVQCCIWSEPMSDRRVFERLVFPRLSAVAETGWTAPERKSWPRFAASAGFLPSLYPATGV